MSNNPHNIQLGQRVWIKPWHAEKDEKRIQHTVAHLGEKTFRAGEYSFFLDNLLFDGFGNGVDEPSLYFHEKETDEERWDRIRTNSAASQK